MIWDDPWIGAATDHGGPPRRFCTMLPPPRPTLGTGLTFTCLQVTDISPVLLSEWRELVGTAWSISALVARLSGAWLAMLRDASDRLVATCVLRNRSCDLWLLETLRAHRGHGTPLMRSAMTWIWDHVGGPFMLGFTWELTVPQLAAAWWRGWLAAAATLQFGWSWRSGAACSFCPNKHQAAYKSHPSLILPTLVRTATGTAIVTDSGLGDGCGYVLVVRGTPDWGVIAERGGWHGLWMRSTAAPPGDGWRPTGEIVVVGLLNCWDLGTHSLEWPTAEISHQK